MIKHYKFNKVEIEGNITPVLVVENNEELDNWIISKAEVLKYI